jgi:phosphoserine phosphatase
MRIAFDLDNTLIRSAHDFALETPTRKLWARLLGKESLRAGIIELAAHCQQQGWQVWVYTTSYRSPGYIRRLFWLYGIQLAGVVNQARHDREVRVRSTKYPPQFGIDLLLDDSEGVRQEGERHGFRVLVISPTDTAWVGKVKAQVAALAVACNAAT